MNTYSKAGKIALLHLFNKKKEIFKTTRYEEMGMVNVFPREVSTSIYLVDLEKEYLGNMVGVLGREKNYKIFFWSVEMGLTEILLAPNENEGKLVDLLIRFSKGFVTHVVIAEKYEWDASNGIEWHLRENLGDTNHCSVEKIVIYALHEDQRRYIANRAYNKELDQFENIEEFTFNHGYFPEKGIIDSKK